MLQGQLSLCIQLEKQSIFPWQKGETCKEKEEKIIVSDSESVNIYSAEFQGTLEFLKEILFEILNKNL